MRLSRPAGVGLKAYRVSQINLRHIKINFGVDDIQIRAAAIITRITLQRGRAHRCRVGDLPVGGRRTLMIGAQLHRNGPLVAISSYCPISTVDMYRCRRCQPEASQAPQPLGIVTEMKVKSPPNVLCKVTPCALEGPLLRKVIT